jgi:hypothetical protein
MGPLKVITHLNFIPLAAWIFNLTFKIRLSTSASYTGQEPHLRIAQQDCIGYVLSLWFCGEVPGPQISCSCIFCHRLRTTIYCIHLCQFVGQGIQDRSTTLVAVK